MKHWTKNLCVLVVGIFATILLAGPAVGAGRNQTIQNKKSDGATYLYKWDSGPPTERFNNSAGVETEDNWVANGFVVVDGATRLLSIEYPLGENFFNQAMTAVIYQGTDISDPSGLVRIQTTDTTVTGAAGTNATIVLDTPVDLNVDDVFYAAILIRSVPGTLFPFYSQGTDIQGHSFFDVGPNPGDPYDLDVTDNATVLGGIHPVLGGGVQSAGNLFLRVNATVTP